MNNNGFEENLPLDQNTIRWAYRMFLGRNPESEEVIEEKLSRINNFNTLRREFLLSEEFKFKNNFVFESYHPSLSGDEPAMKIEDSCDTETLTKIFVHIQESWQKQGKQQPHYSVVSNELFKPENIKTNIRAFRASGKNDFDILVKNLERNGYSISHFKNCLEFGCGVGRVTYWLSHFFQNVYAYDISDPHIHYAKKYLGEGQINNTVFKVLNSLDDLELLPEVDLVYSVIVLQHNPPPLIRFILEKLLNSLKNCGLAYLQIPTYKLGYQFSIANYLNAISCEKFMEMHVLPQSTIFKTISTCGCQLIEILEDECAGGIYKSLSNTLLIRKI